MARRLTRDRLGEVNALLLDLLAQPKTMAELREILNDQWCADLDPLALDALLRVDNRVRALHRAGALYRLDVPSTRTVLWWALGSG